MEKDDNLDMDGISNDIASSLKSDLDTAVAKSDHNQRTILSALISNGLTVKDIEGERLVKIDEDKIGDELEKYSDMYG